MEIDIVAFIDAKESEKADGLRALQKAHVQLSSAPRGERLQQVGFVGGAVIENLE
ncbi:hypothetical protein [Mesorhizobium sp. WSM3876]|uniref:hypothetical protein n=1 Tax=Mesorhizobium sp. WSM3876 TaxID=422277 RepID=UPI0015964EE3|nr:hypothetical protein [Mesorhizobium sp. WSM3876]